ncbi:5'-AMP-activated protein kinase subunit gamma-2-like [Sinocyclocheilus grahami]|uniref:5'-AMP-activated protein kinase subunit gamma-2-like n=1 Tax=Sinocyclocheilus grahami TaxID=75366 RepID=UPI0007AC804F|nr:PREDICTED: 5'-AMP-activated protein kinase subunit gamma-2-like [Sinocyclocheilus grahami]
MGSTAMDSKKKEEKKNSRKRRSLRINMPDLSSLAMSFLEGDVEHANKDGECKGELSCHSASPTKTFFSRGTFSRPSSPMSAPARFRNSPESPKPIFPYSSNHDSSPKCSRRRSFTGIFRSSSKDSTNPSTSPVSIKLFSRARKGSALVTFVNIPKEFWEIIISDDQSPIEASKGELSCHSASPTKTFFSRGTFSRPSSPMSAPARFRNSPESPKPIFPYSSNHDSSPKCSRRRSFTGIFRSSSKDSTNPSTSPVSIKLFSRARKGPGYFLLLPGMDVFAAVTLSLMNSNGRSVCHSGNHSEQNLPEKFRILLNPGIGLHPDSDIRMQKVHNSITFASIQIILTEMNPWL